MAEALILDSEAVHALAHATERRVLADRARAILLTAHERRALVRIPAPVLAKVCRGSRFDAALDRLLNGRGINVCDLTRSIAQRAGGLLSKVGLPSSHAVDAFVVATALEFDRAVIATGDPLEMKRLAAPHRRTAHLRTVSAPRAGLTSGCSRQGPRCSWVTCMERSPASAC